MAAVKPENTGDRDLAALDLLPNDPEQWIKVLLPPGPDGRPIHHNFAYQVPGTNEYTGPWSTDPHGRAGLSIIRRKDLHRHLKWNNYEATHVAPVVDIPVNALAVDAPDWHKRRVSSLVLGESLPIECVLSSLPDDFEQDALDWAVINRHYGVAGVLLLLGRPGAYYRVRDTFVRCAKLGHDTQALLHLFMGDHPSVDPVDLLELASAYGTAADVRALVPKAAAKQFPGPHERAMHEALVCATLTERLDVIEVLLNEFNAPHNSRNKALTKAAYAGKLKSAEALIAAGAQPRFIEVLEHAVQGGSVEMVRLLVAHGATFSPIHLWAAASRGRTEVVKVLMDECNLEPDRALLVFASSHGQADVVRLLLERL